jgi:hypothetical protein
MGAAAQPERHQPRPAPTVLLHWVNDRGRPLLGPAREGRETEEFLRNAHTDIRAVVEVMRQLDADPLRACDL